MPSFWLCPSGIANIQNHICLLVFTTWTLTSILPPSCLRRELKPDLFRGEGTWLGVSRQCYWLRRRSCRRYWPDRHELPGARPTIRSSSGWKRSKWAANIQRRCSGDFAETAWVLLYPVSILLSFRSLLCPVEPLPCISAWSLVYASASTQHRRLSVDIEADGDIAS